MRHILFRCQLFVCICLIFYGTILFSSKEVVLAAELPQEESEEIPAFCGTTVGKLKVTMQVEKNARLSMETAEAENTTETTIEEKKGITIQIGKKQQEIEALNGNFKKKKGVLYFKQQNGKLVKNRFFGKGQNVYYANRKGEIAQGWRKIEGHYYFFDRKSGKLRRNAKADGIKITKNGIAKETKQNIARIKVYMEAQKVVNQVTKPTDSKSQKLYKCYRWMAKFQYKQYRTMRKAKASHPKDWDVIFANDIFLNHNGCCASEASAFAYLAKVCGYKDVSICSDTGHAWVDIGGRLYDPLFAEARSFKDNYNAKYTDYRKHPAYKKKL